MTSTKASVRQISMKVVICAALSITGAVSGMAISPVTPPWRAAAVAVAMRSLSSRPGWHRWA